MSTEVTVQDMEGLKKALAGVRSDENGVDRSAWAAVWHVDNSPNVIEVAGEGESLEELPGVLADDRVMYILIRLTTTFDMSTTVKFVYVRWVGEGVPGMLKAKTGVVHGSVEAYFDPYHLQVETSSTDDLQKDVLIQKLEESSGTRNKVIEGPVGARQERGFTQHTVRAQDKGAPKSVAPQGIDIQVNGSLQQALGAVRMDSDSTTWALATFEGGNVKNPLTLVDCGTGDVTELKSLLRDDQVMYGLYRTDDVIDDITTVKFVYIIWIGESVKPMMKGKVSTVAASIERVFSPHHVAITSTTTSDISPAVIRDKVTSSSGSKSHVK